MSARARWWGPQKERLKFRHLSALPASHISNSPLGAAVQIEAMDGG